MTIQELIRQLQQFDGDLPVTYVYDSYRLDNINNVFPVSTSLINTSPMFYDVHAIDSDVPDNSTYIVLDSHDWTKP